MLCMYATRWINYLRFRYNKDVKTVHALVQCYALSEQPKILKTCGKHCLPVKITPHQKLISLQNIKEKVIFLKTEDCNPFIVRSPNMYGHGVINLGAATLQ